MSAYEKQNGTWMLTAVTSTFGETLKELSAAGYEAACTDPADVPSKPRDSCL